MTLREQLLAAALAEYSTLSAALAAAREAEAWCAASPAATGEQQAAVPSGTAKPVQPVRGANQVAEAAPTLTGSQADTGAQPVTGSSSERVAQGGLRDAVVAALLAGRQPLTCSAIAEQVSRSADCVRTILVRLEGQGRVRRADGGSWSILLRPGEEEATGTPSPPSMLPLSPAEAAVMTFLADGRWHDLKEIEAGTDRDRTYLYSVMQSLRRSGRVLVDGQTTRRRFRSAEVEPAEDEGAAADSRETPASSENLNAGRLPGDPLPGRPMPEEEPSEEERQNRRAAALAIPPARLVKLGGAHGTD